MKDHLRIMLQPGSGSHALDLRFLELIATTFPHGLSLGLDPSWAVSEVLPRGAEVRASWTDSNGVEVLAVGEDYAVYFLGAVDYMVARVAAGSPERAQRVADEFDPYRISEESGEVTVRVWNEFGRTGTSTRMNLATPGWTEISRNYPRGTRSKLDRLVKLPVPSLTDGRLVLLHGEPGTGKTTAIRSVMRAWSPWCDSHLVTDPDRMFASSAYLLEVLKARELGATPTLTGASRRSRWKLVIAEDADAYLRSTARHDAGSGLGRLLNSTDGLLAQSVPVLVILTTNEPLGQLHPAIVRPGRCLAQIEFCRFNRQEAGEWLVDERGAPTEGATLAELYELKLSGVKPVASPNGHAYL